MGDGGGGAQPAGEAERVLGPVQRGEAGLQHSSGRVAALKDEVRRRTLSN